MFDTTAGKLSTAIQMLPYVDLDHPGLREAIGRKLCAAGKRYSTCACEHERNGWVAEFSAQIDAGRMESRGMVVA